MTRLTQRNQITPIMCAAFTQRKLVVNLLHWNQNSSLVALLTERMLCSILITNPFPCTTISSLRHFYLFRISHNHYSLFSHALHSTARSLTQDSLDTLGNFQKSQLYKHLKFREVENPYTEEMKKELLEGFRNAEEFAYMKEYEPWKNLLSGN